MIIALLSAALATTVRVPLYRVVESSESFEYVAAGTTKRETCPKGSVITSFEYGKDLYLDDRIYFTKPLYILDLDSHLAFQVMFVGNEKIDGREQRLDFAAALHGSGPFIDTKGMNQNGPTGGNSMTVVPGNGSEVGIQNVFVAIAGAGNAPVQIHLVNGSARKSLLNSPFPMKKGTALVPIDAALTVKRASDIYHQPETVMKSQLNSKGLPIEIRVGKHKPILARLVGSKNLPLLQELKWFQANGGLRTFGSRNQYLSWVIRTSYLRSSLANALRDSDLGSMARTVRGNDKYPEWLRRQFPRL